MGYELKREAGEVKREFKMKVPRSNEMVASELRIHALAAGEIPVVWYSVNNEWKIFIAGECAKRFDK